MTAELNPTQASTWTDEEIATVRATLVLSIARLKAEIELVSGGLARSVSESTLEVLHDDLDVASHRSELLQDAVQAENAVAILEQTEHVLDRLDHGLYGTCERCSGWIARPRLEAFPRATLCISCA
ncbi:DNA-binding protein [Aeromicrobium sp. A1-2]|uniref:TraR/DksA family transcriptional regulator n=1 Tax=Aeromicrobium sp. A1-2 TaxID=2107713 RepID=UPI000E50C25D|nr:TraR/DksA C4-type zinc finger protein [Aeromicrobium sp. A1-2]AXT86342.1 DNA-binding protein [Aeromicrobium sp. A1-2]